MNLSTLDFNPGEIVAIGIKRGLIHSPVDGPTYEDLRREQFKQSMRRLRKGRQMMRRAE